MFAPMAFMIAQPWVAGVVGIALGAWYAARRRRGLLVAAIAWLAYCANEYGMKRRILCSGECNIRIDLLVLWPALMIGTLVAGWSATRRPRAADTRASG